MYLIIILSPIFTVGNNVSFQKDLKNPCVYPQKAIYNKKYTKLEHNKVYKFLVRLHGEYNILVKLCGNTT